MVMKFALVGLVGESDEPGSFIPRLNVTCPPSSKTVGIRVDAPVTGSVPLTFVTTSDASTELNCVGVAPDDPSIELMIKYVDAVPSVVLVVVQLAMSGSRPTAAIVAAAERFVWNQRVQVVMTILSE